MAASEGGGEGIETMSGTTLDAIHDGHRARREGRSEDARRFFMDAAQRAGDESLRVDALRGWANSESDLGNLDESAERYAEAIALLRGLDDPLRLAHTVRHLGDVTRHQERNEVSVACYNEAIAIYRANEATVPLDLGNALRGYGLLREELGDRAAARLIWEEVLKIYTEVGVQAGIDEATKRVAKLKES